MKNNLRNYIREHTATITMGAAGAEDRFTNNLFDLYSVIESILAADGQKPIVSSIILHQRIYSIDVFGVLPVIVQTAGTWTDTVDIAGPGIIDETFDSCIDDVFGYQSLRPVTQIAKRVPNRATDVADNTKFAVESTIQIPTNILQIVNKEIESERLQNLIFGYVGMATEHNQVIEIKTITEIKFKGIRKTLILR